MGLVHGYLNNVHHGGSHGKEPPYLFQRRLLLAMNDFRFPMSSLGFHNESLHYAAITSTGKVNMFSVLISLTTSINIF